MLAFELVAEALGVSWVQGRSAWFDAKARLKRRGLCLPETTHVEVPGRHRATPQLKAEDAARALRLVLTDPAAVFENDEKLRWLRAKVVKAGGDPKTVDAEVQALETEKQQQEEDAQSLALPGLAGMSALTIRLARENGEVLGSVYDYIKWLGLTDARHEWHNWLSDELRQHLNLDVDATIKIVDVQVTGESRTTPFTTFAGYRLLTKLCMLRSPRRSSTRRRMHWAASP